MVLVDRIQLELGGNVLILHDYVILLLNLNFYSSGALA